MNLTRIQTPNFTQGRGSHLPLGVVVHTTEETFAAAAERYSDPKELVSAHYLVGLDGRVAQLVDEADTAWHAGRVYGPTSFLAAEDPNPITIGIEFEDGGDPLRAWRTDQQYRSGAGLLRGISERWAIPLDREHVVGHREVFALKSCPGNLDIERLLWEARQPPSTLGSLAAAAGDLLLSCEGDPETPVPGLSHDLYAVCEGDLFFCADESLDPSSLALQAVARGAGGLCERVASPTAVPRLLVTDVRRAMALLAAEFSGRPAEGMLLLGVTGSNGKTTTAYLLESILWAAGHRPGLIGSVRAQIAGRGIYSPGTTPDAPRLYRLLAQMRAEGVDSAALEVSSHALALHRVEGLRFAAACFTNLTPDHLDFHGSIESYFEAKRSLFVPERTQGAAINVDDPFGRILLDESRVPCLGFGMRRPAQVRASEVRLGQPGTDFRLHSPAGEALLHTHLVGRFNVYNCLAAAATAFQAGISLEAVQAGLESLKSVPGRLERIDLGQPFVVLVDFARTPDELRAALEAARLLAGTGGRLACVLGCPEDGDRAQRRALGEAAARAADKVVVTLDSPGYEDPLAGFEALLAGARSAGARPKLLPDRREAIAHAVTWARPGDVVVIAGRGVEPFYSIYGRSFRLDDRDAARSALRSAGWGTS